MTEARPDRRMARQRERRARHQQDHILTAAIRAVGDADPDHWLEDEEPQAKPQKERKS